MALLLAATITSSIPKAVDATLANLGPLEDPRVEAELKAHARRLHKVELENEATRVVADMTGFDAATTSCDLVTTGIGFALGGVEENDWVLYGSKTNALIITGVKGLVFAGKFLLNRRQATAWVACEMERYDGAAKECNHLRGIKLSTAGKSAGDLAFCGWNIAQIVNSGKSGELLAPEVKP